MRSLEGGQGHGGFTQAVQQHPLEASSSCLSRLLSTACCLSCIGCFMSQGGSCKKLHPETEKKTFISFKEWRNLSYKPPNRLSVTSYWPKLYHYILYAKKKKKKNQWHNSAISIKDFGCCGSERVQASSEARGYPHLNRS